MQESRDLQPQNQIFSLDGLFCDEERFEDDLGGWSCFENEVYPKINVKKPLSFFESDLFWEDDELLTLLSKEKQAHFGSGSLDLDGSLMVARKEALDWMFKVIGHYGFNALTAVLAVNYFDRLISGVSFQKDKPWMSQLAAVACLSIAAKVEEIEVPLLLDFQEEVDECYNLILEVIGHHGKQHCRSLKRKYESLPGSPNGVIDAYFSCESSNDSWALAPSVGSSPELLYKRSRSRDQQMRLAPLSSVRGCG
nr:D-type cyclin family 3 subgroup 1 [Ipomoea batatas]GMD00938.1 D-type cyclin family 3 subgroup 1 [Ipomoea batatas]